MAGSWSLWSKTGASTSGPSEGALLSFSKGERIVVGELPAGSAIISFDVRNDSSGRVRFEKVTGSCTCVDVRFATDELGPGESEECRIQLAVSPGVTQSSTITFLLGAPRREPVFVFLEYSGVQRDRLELGGFPERGLLAPDEEFEFDLSCDWEVRGSSPSSVAASFTSEGADPIDVDLISWSLPAAQGLHLLKTSETRLSATHRRSTATFLARSSGREIVSAVVEVLAGFPTRARKKRSLSFQVMPSFRLDPEIVEIAFDRDKTSEIPPLSVVASVGWEVFDVGCPPWLRCDLEGDRILCRVLGSVPQDRGIYRVTVRGRDRRGHTATKYVELLVDPEVASDG